ncbi:polysaccharide biosynthesis tyrosine autokinase [Pseudarthrobacter sp. WHRI 8279]|uniref:polysaccharide biosynthesis tyrosine autokinase n=1 Tax=Pseudarthrobacter sp. WHRI 8279 TaxID=3162566 RepID=UPI0032EF80AA
MELNEYLKIAKRNWLTIVASALLGLLIAGAASLIVKPSYVAETKLFVAIQGSGSITELQQGNTFSQARVRSYVETVSTPAVLQPAIDRLGLELTAAELQEKVDAGADLNTVIITISVSDASPVSAAAIAQAVGTSLIEVVNTLESPSSDGLSPVKLSVVTPATAPVAPSAPNTRLYLLVGLIAGASLGVAVAVLRTTLDTRVRGEQDVRRLSQAPVLGGIAFDNEAARNTLLTQVHPQSPRAESFRQIRTNLQFAHVGHKSKAVLITSSLPGEGKTTTATNLAIALAQAGQSVVLVDADLRRPRVDDYLGLDRNAGLTTALVGAADVNDLLQPWGEDDFFVLTSGQIPPNPSELLGSEAMNQLILGLEAAFDAVIIDAPPLLPVTDAAVLAQQVGGVVLVIGSSKVKSPELEKSLRALEMVDADLLGVVLNLLPSKGPDAYAYGYATYQTTPGQPQQDLTRPARRLSNARNSKASATPETFYQESRSE